MEKRWMLAISPEGILSERTHGPHGPSYIHLTKEFSATADHFSNKPQEHYTQVLRGKKNINFLHRGKYLKYKSYTHTTPLLKEYAWRN